MFDARAWMVWLAAAVVVTMTTRNPFYTLIILLAVQAVGVICARPSAGQTLPLARIGLMMVAFTTVFNTLMAHVGETVLFRLPGSWPLVGGAITAEAAVFGASNGLILLALLAIFTGLNRAVSAGELARLTPRAWHDLGIVILIALTYAPETMRQLRRIRQAQAIRGHRLRGVRDWRPILIPLLVGGLERAMGLAEAMVSRGYGATAGARQPLAVQLALLAGLLLAFGGWALGFWIGWPGWALLGVGVVVLATLLRRLGQQHQATRYRPRPWTMWDTGLAGTAVLSLLFMGVPLPFINRASLAYSPYPALTWPTFDPLLALNLLWLLFPAVAATINQNNDKI